MVYISHRPVALLVSWTSFELDPSHYQMFWYCNTSPYVLLKYSWLALPLVRWGIHEAVVAGRPGIQDR